MIVRTRLSAEQVRDIETPGRGARKIGAPVVTVRAGVCEPAGKSSTHANRLDVLLIGNGRYADGLCNYGPMRKRGGYSPHHDEYGDWCAALFALDPHAVIGPYRGLDDFDAKTDGQYT